MTLESDPLKRLKSVASGVGAGLVVGFLLDGLNVGIGGSSGGGGEGVEGLTPGMLVGLVSGGFIGLNNLVGNRVYVYNSEEQAANRLVQDYASGTLSGLTLRKTGSKLKGDRTIVARGKGGDIVGCVDFVYRRRGSRGTLPNHVHCKNMLVSKVRRRATAEREDSKSCKLPYALICD